MLELPTKRLLAAGQRRRGRNRTVRLSRGKAEHLRSRCAKRTSGEGNATDGLAGLEAADLRDDAPKSGDSRS
jgi:hypothetical protein